MFDHHDIYALDAAALCSSCTTPRRLWLANSAANPHRSDLKEQA
jgi:hypothetical protein